jgi:class 3 adenylate cyclase
MLNDAFETLTAALRPRGGQVLKFIGDAMLAAISFDERDEKAVWRKSMRSSNARACKARLYVNGPGLPARSDLTL